MPTLFEMTKDQFIAHINLLHVPIHKKEKKEEEYIFTDTDIDDTIDVLQSPTRQTRILNVCKQRWARLTRSG